MLCLGTHAHGFPEEAARMAFFERIHDLLAVWYLSEGPKLKGAYVGQHTLVVFGMEMRMHDG